MTEKFNAVNPSHYAGGETSLECIECMQLAFGEEATYNFCLCNAFKYMWRYKNKNGGEDLDKARWYLNYVAHDIERDGEEHISHNVITMFRRLNDLWIDIQDRITNRID